MDQEAGFELRNLTTAASLDHTIVVPGANVASAEVIADQRGITQGPLSNFGTMSFTDSTIDNQRWPPPIHCRSRWATPLAHHEYRRADCCVEGRRSSARRLALTWDPRCWPRLLGDVEFDAVRDLCQERVWRPDTKSMNGGVSQTALGSGRADTLVAPGSRAGALSSGIADDKRRPRPIDWRGSA